MRAQDLPRFESVEEVANAVAEVRDELGLKDHGTEAQELTSALERFYTTASEALGEIREALRETRGAWQTLSPKYQRVAEHSIEEATRLLRMI